MFVVAVVAVVVGETMVVLAVVPVMWFDRLVVKMLRVMAYWW